jgi:hypothetical protein
MLEQTGMRQLTFETDGSLKHTDGVSADLQEHLSVPPHSRSLNFRFLVPFQ